MRSRNWRQHLHSQLSKAQKEAVMHKDGPMMVLAGPGSGKTLVITKRIQYLISHYQIPPQRILVITFTRAAANEMKERFWRLAGETLPVSFGTFHSVFFTILKYAYHYSADNILPEHKKYDFIREIITDHELEIDDEADFMRQIIQEISLVKGQMIPLAYYHSGCCGDEVFKEIYRAYEEKLHENRWIDFDDILVYTYELLKEREDIRKAWQQKFPYILIDEFQDIDKLQYRLMEVLCGYHKNLFIVGDPDQTIYTWRGADVKFLLDFDKHFPGVKTIMMMENYRSTPEILSVANSLIAKNQNRMQKDLLPTLPGGKPVLCHHGKTAEEEAIWMAKKIEELHQDGVPYREITILYRAHYLTRTVEEVFLKEKIPYTIYSGIQFFGRMEIKDALSYLRMLAYKDDLSFARIANVPKRNLGERRMAFLREYAEQNQCSLYDALRKNLEHEMMKGTKAASFVSLIENLASNVAERPVSEVLSEILDMSGYEKMLRTEGSQERLDNLAELKQSIYEYETTCGEEATLEHYLTHVALFTNSDLESGKDQVRMMTVHSAKGLEFPYVFLCGMNEGIFPSRKTNTKQAMEEERRLAFVAVTRAEKGLFLTEAEGRNFDGSMRYPSRFLLDIDEKYLTHTEPLAKDRYAEARCYIAGKERYLEEQEKGASFISGDRIQHPIFGKGSILEVDTERGAYLIRFDEMETFRSISIRAKLEKIDF